MGWKVDNDCGSSPEERPEKIVPAFAPKRPKELACDIHQVTYKGQKWVALVGKLENQPYELFAGHSSMLSLPSKCNKGKIIKSGSRDDLSDRGKHLEVTAEGLTGSMAASINLLSHKNIEADGKDLRIYLNDEKDSVNVHRIIVEGGGWVQSLSWKSESLEELFYRLVKA